jgi:hypothetical protein
MATSVIRLAGTASIFAMQTSEPQFARHMNNVEWTHRLTLDLP